MSISSPPIHHCICPACGTSRVTVFWEADAMPVHCNLIYRSKAEALEAPLGRIRLGMCEDCGLISNQEFDPDLMEYAGEYENTLHCSPQFQQYAAELAAKLAERYRLPKKTVLEIGCGGGEFLTMLCDIGGCQGIGLDPSAMHGNGPMTRTGAVTFIRDFYSQKYSRLSADLVCCRQVLEHMADPVSFLTMLRASIGDGTAVFFEVPNVMFTLRHGGIWDVIYEHCNYFSANSLVRTFIASGYDIREVSESFGGQFLCLEAFPHPQRSGRSRSQPVLPPVDTREDVRDYAQRHQRKMAEWHRNLDVAQHRNQKLVLWGAGSKGTTFLNLFKARQAIEYVVDINERKWGTYIPGSGEQIVAPSFLKEHRPDQIVAMNPAYVAEIQQELAGMEIECDVVTA